LTTEFDATTELSPIETPGRMVQLLPTQTLLPIEIGSVLLVVSLDKS
jgi:hypothetical protein